jgi:hypothetical protein
MNIDTGKLLNRHDMLMIQKYIDKHSPRMATLILFLACRRAYPSINPERLYKVCWYKIRARIEPNKPL